MPLVSRVSRAMMFATLIALGVLAAAPVSSQAPQAPGRASVLISFVSAPGPNDRALVTAAGGRIRFTYDIVPAIAADLPEAALVAIAANPRVAFIEPDIEVFADDAELDNTWGVKAIGAGFAHESDPAIAGAGINVAVIDSGIDYTHPDLAANYVTGYDFYNNDADPMDDCGHGTHVAGTIGAVRNGVGVVGVAHRVNLYALKFLSPGTGTSCSGPISAALAAVDWAVQHGMHITNNSWGGTGYSATADQAFANAAAAGLLHIASAGNRGTCDATGDNVGYPAGYRSVVATAAVDSTDTRACFSSTGPNVEMAAPGVQINSTTVNGNYGSKWNGTSMASPHVAGTAALLFGRGLLDANGNGRTNDEIRNAIAASALDLGAAGRDPLYGFGRVRVPEALAAAAVAPPLTIGVDQIRYALSGGGKSRNKDLTITVGSVYGLAAPTSATVTIEIRLNGALHTTGTIATDGNGLGSLVIRNAPAGSYVTTVTWAAAGGLTWDGITPANGFVK